MKITLCGSTRYKKEYLEVNKALTLAGHVVYSVSMWSHNTDERIDPTEEEKTILDLVHLAKIEESDAIVVIDILLASDGSLSKSEPYVGSSTKREIQWASIRSKDVYFVSQFPSLPALIEFLGMI